MCFRDVQEGTVVLGSAVGLAALNTLYGVTNICRGLEPVTLQSHGLLVPIGRCNVGPDLIFFCTRPALEPNGVGAGAGGCTLG